MVSVCADDRNIVTAVFMDDLSAQAGWHWMECDLLPTMDIFDPRGVAMYKLENGIVVPRSFDEMESDARAIPKEIDEMDLLKFRTDANEAAIAGFMDLLMGVM